MRPDDCDEENDDDDMKIMTMTIYMMTVMIVMTLMMAMVIGDDCTLHMMIIQMSRDMPENRPKM